MSDGQAAYRAKDRGRFSILFVCTGNVCRSPFAEIFTRHLLVGRLGGRGAGAFRVSSAGTHAVRGSPIDRRTRAELAPWRLDVTAAEDFVARQLDRTMLDGADLVLCATRRHRSAVIEASSELRGRVFTVREFARLVENVDLASLPAQPVARAHRLIELAARGQVGDPPAAPGRRGPARPGRAAAGGTPPDSVVDPGRGAHAGQRGRAARNGCRGAESGPAAGGGPPAGCAGPAVPGVGSRRAPVPRPAGRSRFVSAGAAGTATRSDPPQRGTAGPAVPAGAGPAPVRPPAGDRTAVRSRAGRSRAGRSRAGRSRAEPTVEPGAERTVEPGAERTVEPGAERTVEPGAERTAGPAPSEPPSPPPSEPAGPPPEPPSEPPGVPASEPGSEPASEPPSEAASPTPVPSQGPPASQPASQVPSARAGPAAVPSADDLPAARGTEPYELTAIEQAAAIRRRELSPTELVEHALKRIEELDPVLGAFVTVIEEAARAQASEAERSLSEPAPPPPLLGVPTAIKDLAITAGVRTSFGSEVYADFVPQIDDDSARLLREAGAISLGKTATPEFGLAPYTEPAGRPPAVTPWDISRLAGGSSGGAAAAVAGGLVAVAHATDGGGSIRIPAAVCGLVGLKPTRGLVSRGPAGGDPLGLSVAGPLARTVTDAAALLDALAVPVPSEPGRPAGSEPAGSYLGHAMRATPGRLRIGRYATPPVPDLELDPECLAGYERASTLLAELGHEIVEVDPGVEPEFVTVFETIWAVLSHSYPVDPDSEDKLMPLTRWWRERGAAVSGPEMLTAMQRAGMAARKALAAHAVVDVVLTPTLAQLPRPVGWFTQGDPAEDYRRQKMFTPFTALYNVTGQPALTVPLHWTEDPVLPVGVQLVGMPGDDGLLLELGGQLEAAAPWRHRRPTIAGS